MIEINLLLMSVDSLVLPTPVTFRLDFFTLLFSLVWDVEIVLLIPCFQDLTV